MIFYTKVQGIPCQCQVTLLSVSKPPARYGTGAGDVSPPESMELEIRLLDSRGFQAHWLEKKMTQEDKTRLQKEFLLERDAEAYSYAH